VREGRGETEGAESGRRACCGIKGEVFEFGREA